MANTRDARQAFPRITLVATTFDPLAFLVDRYAAGNTVEALEALGARSPD
jgi:hypothetical protein